MIEIGALDKATILHLSMRESADKVFVINGEKTHFKLREFQSKDGADEVLVCAGLVRLLENIRLITGQPVRINSAYRTADHNAKVGGSPKSQHLVGKAADIVVGVGHNNVGNALKVAWLASQLGANGIGVYKTFTHVDVRDYRSYWDETGQNLIFMQKFNYE